MYMVPIENRNKRGDIREEEGCRRYQQIAKGGGKGDLNRNSC